MKDCTAHLHEASSVVTQLLAGHCTAELHPFDNVYISVIATLHMAIFIALVYFSCIWNVYAPPMVSRMASGWRGLVTSARILDW